LKAIKNRKNALVLCLLPSFAESGAKKARVFDAAPQAAAGKTAILIFVSSVTTTFPERS